MKKPSKYASVAKCVGKITRSHVVDVRQGHPTRGGDAPTIKEGRAKIKSIEDKRCSEEVWNRICAEFNEMEDQLFQKKRRHG